MHGGFLEAQFLQIRQVQEEYGVLAKKKRDIVGPDIYVICNMEEDTCVEHVICNPNYIKKRYITSFLYEKEVEPQPLYRVMHTIIFIILFSI